MTSKTPNDGASEFSMDEVKDVEVPAGVDRRTFMMRSAVVSAAALMTGRTVSAAEQTARATAEPPKVEPPRAETPSAEVVKPAIDRATITSVIGQHRPEILKCIAEAKKKSPELKGTMTLQLQVDPDGRVRAQVQSTLGSPLVGACVIKAASGWRFPARAGGDFANVAYPFTIN